MHYDGLQEAILAAQQVLQVATLLVAQQVLQVQTMQGYPQVLQISRVVLQVLQVVHSLLQVLRPPVASQPSESISRVIQWQARMQHSKNLQKP